MYSDKKCIVCGKLMPNSHHLKKYCSEACLKYIKKQKEKMITEIRRKRNEEFERLPESEKREILMEARRDIMESLENGTPLYRCKY